jgi:hypothetical protein
MAVITVLHSAEVVHTTGFRAFAESRVPLGEGFTESELSMKASRCLAAGEVLFD